MNVVVYVRAADLKMLEADGYDVKDWVKTQVENALAAKRKTKEAQ
jgi:hypothetical protein